MHNKHRSVVFATSYLANETVWISRYLPWINYYKQSPLADIPLLLIDDGSPYIPSSDFIHAVDDVYKLDLQPQKVNIFRFNDNLGRSSLTRYPGWWRSFLFSAEIAQHLDLKKLIHIESDAYILSNSCFGTILELSKGWTSPWLPKYGLPETGIQIICEDQLTALANIKNHPDLNKRMAEEILPFTDIRRDWIGDRYSEFKRNRWVFRSKKFDRFKFFQRDFFYEPIPANADFATQVVPRQLKDTRLRGSI